MDTTIKKVSDVEYDLEIRATANDLADEFNTALKAQRARTSMKGFRPGKVPIGVVKKLYGKALAFGVAEKSIQETYESSVMQQSEHDVLGRPKITTLDYEMDGDLFAVVRFGVRPDFELAGMEDQTVSRLVHEVTDEEVRQEIEAFLEQRAEYTESEGPVRADQLVVVDLQQVDHDGNPIPGRKDEGLSFYLGKKRVKDEFRDAVVGAKPGDVVTIKMSHDHDDGTSHTHTYLATINEVKDRKLPELTDALVKEATSDKFETADAFRDEVRSQIAKSWEKQSRDLLEGMVVERMLELNPVDVPESVIELYLDSFVDDITRQGEGKVPEGFDEEAFRSEMAPEAERQGRWMLIRDHIIKDREIKVGDEDVEKHILSESGLEGMDPQIIMQYYRNIPGLIERTKQRLVSERVFDHLIERFELIDKSKDEIEAERKEEMEARRKAEASLAGEAEGEGGSWWRKPIEKWNQWRNPR